MLDFLYCNRFLAVHRAESPDCRKSEALEKQSAMSAEQRKEAAKRPVFQWLLCKLRLGVKGLGFCSPWCPC